jgi:hypothetical protein
MVPPAPPKAVTTNGTVGVIKSWMETPPSYEPGPLFTTVMAKVQAPVDWLRWAVF